MIPHFSLVCFFGVGEGALCNSSAGSDEGETPLLRGLALDTNDVLVYLVVGVLEKFVVALKRI